MRVALKPTMRALTLGVRSLALRRYRRMDPSDIRLWVTRLDTRRSLEEETAWERLRPLEEAVVPYLLEFFPTCRSREGRTALVYHAIRYARVSDAAFQLGIRALGDRSYMVRYRGCGLLAYSLRQDALPALRELLVHEDQKTVKEAEAAIDAITNRNHHFFFDRDHTGRAHWVVNPEDDER